MPLGKFFSESFLGGNVKYRQRHCFQPKRLTSTSKIIVARCKQDN